MKAQLLLIAIVILAISSNGNSHKSARFQQKYKDSVIKIEMHLSAYGVESDDFPSIVASIDLVKGKSSCLKTFYDPKHKDSSYTLTPVEMKAIRQLIKIPDFEKLKHRYEDSATDEPTSTTVIYTTKHKFVVSDYGLIAENPLHDLYKIVYKY